MRIDLIRLRGLARKRDLSLNALLAKAGVSKTAFYHLVHKGSVLPASLLSLAEALSVRPSAFLTEKNSDVAKVRRVLRLTDRIVGGDPKLDRDNVRLTLLLLEEEPIWRLRRSLIRGRKRDLHKETIGRPKDILTLPVLRDALATIKKKKKLAPRRIDKAG